MIRRSLAVVLLAFVCYVLYVDGQSTPAPPPKAEGFAVYFDGDGGYLGVQTAEVTKENFAKFGLKDVRGVAVEKVVPGSPAEKAGVQAGDVIVAFNGEEVTSVRKLTRLLGEVAADHQAKVTILRNGNERELTATVGKRPMPKFEEGNFKWISPPGEFKLAIPPGEFHRWTLPPGEFPKMPEVPPMPRLNDMPDFDVTIPGTPDTPYVWQGFSGRRIGAGVTTLTKQLSEHFGVAGGVLVNDVRADSPAAKAGLKAGDIIVEADGKEVRNDGDLMRIVQEKKEGDVNLTVVRNGNRQTIRVTPEKMDGSFNFKYERPDTPMAVPQEFKFTMPAMPTPPMPMTEFKFPGRVL